jgi:hypothetical protein
VFRIRIIIIIIIIIIRIRRRRRRLITYTRTYPGISPMAISVLVNAVLSEFYDSKKFVHICTLKCRALET